jgi:uncharacterized protein YcsI (UPF0317 family)
MNAVTDMTMRREDFAHASGADVRAAIRAGRWTRTTHGLAKGYVQANLAIVPERYAFDFLRFCQRNPKPCPLLDVTDPGNPEATIAAPGSDLRTDLSGYRIYRDGKLAGEVRNIRDLWRADHVGFLLGCSMSFDEILAQAGIPQRHLDTEQGRMSIYISNIPCRSAGLFGGPMVVGMRPIPKRLLTRAIEITARYPIAHGSPVHIGNPVEIGIGDPARVDWGVYNAPHDDELPVYWGCGITPQAVAIASGIPEMIAHSAGHMFVSDLKLAALAQ